jgi:sulfatase maturation enzyme AslB (radical SAM superfamily)
MAASATEATEEVIEQPVEQQFVASAPAKKKRFEVIYEPEGPALEYSPWACNIVKSPNRISGKGHKPCSFTCLYCYLKHGTESGPVLKDDVLNRLKKDLVKLKKVIQLGQRV